MPRNYDQLEQQVLRASKQALADGRTDVADHLLYALEALDLDAEGPALKSACQSIPGERKARPQRH
ncbi:hypothetical protein [Microvirga roseola]|uniref:hypothetical protein n=1 Tax=Microvirga roseola TaxID=2883126 RepID=UPI001E2FEF20|nr:hypothetical protein [Microvirga roseola]